MKEFIVFHSQFIISPFLSLLVQGGNPMGLSNRKEEELKKMPRIQFLARKSKDGKFIIHQTIVTDIKPIAYYEKVLTNTGAEQLVTTEELALDEELRANDI